MGSESMQTITDPMLRSKVPIFNGTLPSTGLSKQPIISSLLSEQTLQYSGAYTAYDPRGKDRARFTPPWSNSKMTLLDGRSQLSHLSGMMGQNHIIYRQDSTSTDESHCHSSSLRHTPSKPGFVLYAKSPEVSSPGAASGGIRKQKSGCENSPSHSENSVYLAIPKPVYRHTHCCNELGCVIGPTYSVEHGNPGIPNTVYEREWMQSGAQYTELSPMQRKAQDTLLQQRDLQLEQGEDPLKRITVEAYSPGRTRTLPAIIQPTYSAYPCAPTRSLFGSFSEHGQSLQSSPRGYPGLYSSHPTYERMTSEVYQEHSPMSKYGQLAQHPLFYYPQANVEGENRAQCKDSGSKKREDVPVIHKHPITHPQEHYIVPQSLHAKIPSCSTEMLPTHSLMPGFEYPCYAVPRFHLDASQIRSPLKRQHASPSFHASCINVSPSSQHRHLSMAAATSPHNNKARTSLRVDHFKASSPFLLMDQPSPTRLVSQPGVSPASIQIGRFFSPLTGMHLDPAVFSPAGLNRDKHVDYSSCEAYPIQPKSLPVPPAGWKSQTPGHDSDRMQTARQSDSELRKLFSPAAATVNTRRGSVPTPEATGHKNDLKRSISQVTPPIKIKEEDKDIYEVELSKKQKMNNLQGGNISNVPPMPVIDTVFSLAPYLQASRRRFPSGIPQRPVHSPEQPEVRHASDAQEKMPDRDERDPVVDVASEEIHPDTVIQKVKNIKVEKVEPSDMDHSEETRVPHTDYSEVIIKKELSDGDPSDSEATLLKKTHESDERDIEPPSAAQYETSEETKPAVLPPVNSSCHGDAHSLYEQARPQPVAVQMPQLKLDFKNIPSQCLKLNRYNIVLHSGSLSRPTVLPSERTPVQPVAEPEPKLEIHMPVRKHFLELHHSLCKLLSKSVSASSEPELKSWLCQLQITEPKSPSTKVRQVSCLLGEKAREVWINEEMKLALQEVLQRLSEYKAQDRCPFPHVYRAGAVFLPMLVVKELLFPMVQGGFVDQVLQEHKVGLRPTTLSEEKILIQLHKRACSSRLRRLMSLKHLPDIYADMVNILYYTYVCKHLESGMEPDRREQDVGFEASDSCMPAVFSDSTASAESPSQTQTQRDMKDQETQPQWNNNRSKSRVKSSSRRMFLDNGLSEEEEEEEEAADIEQTVVGGVLDSFPEEYPGAHECQETDNGESDHTAAEQESSHVAQSPAAENSWTCPLMFDDLSHGDGESENLSSMWPVDQSSSLVKPQLRPKKHPGMILKLRRMLSGGLNRKKARYQAVPEVGTFADPSPLPSDDGEGVIGERTTTVTHRWQRTEGLPHALRPLSSSSKRKSRPLLNIKYCPYLSACHSAEHRRRWVLRSAVQRAHRAMKLYPDLVGKRIRHLYEEDDKSEVWYRGEVVRIHEAHTNPLKTIFEVRYDSEPEWKYYLELLIDYKKGWLKIED